MVHARRLGYNVTYGAAVPLAHQHSLCMPSLQKPTNAFVFASWIAVATGILGFIIGLWQSDLLLNEKYYYVTILLFGLFAVVSLQKSVRDRLEGIKVTDIYYGICWFGVLISLTLLTAGLISADLLPSEKGFYAFAYLLGIFGAVTVQKNTRDNLLFVQNDTQE